jgi:hypothetical protein
VLEPARCWRQLSGANELIGDLPNRLHIVKAAGRSKKGRLIRRRFYRHHGENEPAIGPRQ